MLSCHGAKLVYSSLQSGRLLLAILPWGLSVSHTEELLQLLLPILKSEVATTYPPKVYRKELFNHNFATFQVNGIDFYINGHDHCLYSVHASVVSSLIQYFTSGGGSRAWRGFFQPIKVASSSFMMGKGSCPSSYTRTKLTSSFMTLMMGIYCASSSSGAREKHTSPPAISLKHEADPNHHWRIRLVQLSIAQRNRRRKWIHWTTRMAKMSTTVSLTLLNNFPT